jgi:Na+-translocating ferredoxin:NAD+ oxidoreductase RnfC subunit
MSERETILRVGATYDLTVRVGDKVRQGEYTSAGLGSESKAPVSGVVRSIEFDPDDHEFVIAIIPKA